MTARVVYLNGQFVPESAARLSIYDSALVNGDMAFDVTRTFRHRPFRLRCHLERLFHSMTVLEIDPGLSLDALEHATLETLDRNLVTEDAEVDWNIIHNASRGPAAAFWSAFAPGERRPTLTISCFPLVDKLAPLAPAYDTGVDLIVPAQRAVPGNLVDASIKTRSRVAFQIAQLQAAHRALGSIPVLVDPEGHLTETTSANLFLVSRGKLWGPESRNVLPGVTRTVVCELAAAAGIEYREVNLTVADAQGADELFITSTSIGLLHARSFEGKPVGDGRLGPVARRLRDALTVAVGIDIAEQARQYAARQK